MACVRSRRSSAAVPTVITAMSANAASQSPEPAARVAASTLKAFSSAIATQGMPKGAGAIWCQRGVGVKATAVLASASSGMQTVRSGSSVMLTVR